MYLSTRDSRNLKYSLWYDEMPSTGTLRLKRVSAEREKQFPREYRLILARRGPLALVTALRKNNAALTLADAWNHVKTMLNGGAR